MKIKTTPLVFLISAMSFASSPVVAEQALTADEARALFSNKTFDVHSVSKGKDLKAYASAEGVHALKKANGKIKQGKWHIDSEGRHCVELKKEKCSTVISVAEGVYHKISDGEHTHTLKNFVNGNQL